MNELEMKEIREAIKDFAEGLRAKFDSVGEFNLQLSSEYLKERSYRLSNLYITLNVGILSVSSFILTGQDLNPWSRYFVPFLFGSIIAIIIEVINRKLMLRILDKDAWGRMGNADKCNLKIAEKLQLHFISDPMRCSQEFSSITQCFSVEEQEQHKITNKKLKPILIARIFAETLSLISLIALLVIALSELRLLPD